MTSAPHLLERARDTLLAAAEALPRAGEVESLREELSASLARGYLKPDEDIGIRRLFARYLHTRSALHETLASLRPLVPRFGRRSDQESLQAFVAAWLAGCMLMRAARYLIREFHDHPEILRLLNQAEPALGLPGGMLDRIHDSAARPSTLLRYFRAARYAEARAEDIAALRDDPLTGPLLPLLEAEAPFVENQKRRHAKAYARCRLHHVRRRPVRHYKRVMWGLFETSGRAIAEMRNPLHRRRVTARVRKTVSATLQPGDVLITRPDDADSTLFLPGFWPHAAFVIGHPHQRAELDVQTSPDREERSRAPVCILEAKKDGVRFRALRETLAVDAFVLLRPKVQSPENLRLMIERALSHEGKLYDFEFDFTRPDRLVCTEVAYRAMDGVGGLHFNLTRQAGRFALPAEELLRQGLAQDLFDVKMLYGVRGNQLFQGDRAKELLLRTLEPNRSPLSKSNE